MEEGDRTKEEERVFGTLYLTTSRGRVLIANRGWSATMGGAALSNRPQAA